MQNHCPEQNGCCTNGSPQNGCVVKEPTINLERRMAEVARIAACKHGRKAHIMSLDDVAAYARGELSRRKVAKKYKVAEATVNLMLLRSGYTPGQRGKRGKARRIELSQAVMHDLQRSELSIKEIAVKHGIDTNTMRLKLIEKGIYRSITGDRTGRRNREMLELIRDGATLKAVSERFNVTRERVRQIVERQLPQGLFLQRCTGCERSMAGRRIAPPVFCPDCMHKIPNGELIQKLEAPPVMTMSPAMESLIRQDMQAVVVHANAADVVVGSVGETL